MRAERSSTIGTERLTNYALQLASREDFVKQLTENLPARPEYFLEDAEINRDGAAPLADLPPLPRLSAKQVRALMDQGAPVLDVRPGDQFAAGSIPGAINIALSGQFAIWAGTILGLAGQPVLVAGGDEQLYEATLRLARVGIDAERGYLGGGVEAWAGAGFELAPIPQISAPELRESLAQNRVQVLDVRREPEWKAGHIANARLFPLDRFSAQLPAPDKTLPLVVHCKSGYRSMIACSLLKKAGYESVTNLAGGFDAWELAKLPISRE